MRQCLLLLMECFILMFFQLQVFYLPQLESEVVLFGLGSFGLLACFVQLALCFAVGSEACAVLADCASVLGYGVEHGELEILFAQQEILMLGVNVGQQMGQRAQVGHGDRCVVDKTTALASGCQFASDDAFAILAVQFVLGTKGLQLGSCLAESPFDGALCGTWQDAFRVGTLPCEQSDGTQQDALSRSCFAGDDGETVVPIDIQFLNKYVVAYAEMRKHVCVYFFSFFHDSFCEASIAKRIS